MLTFFLLTSSRRSVLLQKFGLCLRIQRPVVCFSLCLLTTVGLRAQTVFINELTYDSRQLFNNSLQEIVPNLVEIAGPAGTNVTSWSLVFYGSDPDAGNSRTNLGRVYGSMPIFGLIQNQQNGYGTLGYALAPSTLQTAPGSGIALVNSSGKVVQLISYGGPLTAMNGPAAGMVAQVIPRVHGPTNGILSLQLRGTGVQYTDFTWSELSTYTPGRINAGFPTNPQVFSVPTSVTLSVNPSTVTEGTTGFVVATVTASVPVAGNQSVRLRGSGNNITSDDFSIRNETVTILSGATSGSTVVTIKDDALVEGTDTLRLTIDSPSAAIVLGATTSQNVIILDNDVAPGRFTLTQPAYNCSTGVITFNTSGGDGSPITYFAPGIQRSAETDRSGTVDVGLRNDPKILTIRATQSGTTVSYSFDFAAYCADVTPPSTTTALSNVGSYEGHVDYADCRMTGGWVWNRTYPDRPITVEIVEGTAVVGIVTAENYRSDLQQAGKGNGKHGFDWTIPDFLRDGQPHRLTVRVLDVGYELISSDRTIRCINGAPRLAAPEPTSDEPISPLTVTVLGNPVVGDVVKFEIRGAGGQSVQSSLIDTQGHTLSEATINQPGAVEQQTLPLSQPAGLYLLRVTSQHQSKTVKVLKQ